MNGEIPVIEAVEWREPAPGGGSQAQVFRLSDGRFALVKFPENSQGELVLANEFICCQFAEHFDLPVNRAVRVLIDERLLRGPRQSGQIPNSFSAGVRCGMIRFENPEVAPVTDIENCANAAALHHIVAFEQLMNRQDGRQLLIYVGPEKTRQFGAYDYGFALGGNGNWTISMLPAIAPPVLPGANPFTGAPYADGAALGGFIDKLRVLTRAQIEEILLTIYPPRWGVSVDDMQGIANFLEQRTKALVKQFDERYQPPPQMI
ncbi:MAG: hypothetical protein M3N48_01765 [Verrucomicrobiota bacterium]|nr:hypothetical protein [Verrucomicrobiota bacterium]